MPLSEIFIASIVEAESIGAAEAPLQRFSGADLKYIDYVKLDRLLGLIENRPFDAELKDFPIIADHHNGEILIFHLSPRLTAFLAKLDECQTVEWGIRWSALEEFRLDRFTQNGVVSVTKILCRLAREASAQRKDMFLWMCT